MVERYSDADGAEAGVVAERGLVDAELHQLLARLLPGANAELLVRALREEAARRTPAAAPGTLAPRDDTQLAPPERELRRVREQLALGDAAKMLQHSINNPLTALLAEAQMLELEPLAEEHRVAVTRIVELARRVAAVARRLDSGSPAAGPRARG